MIVLNAKIFQQKIAPALKESLGLKNIHQVPRIVKVSLNADWVKV